MKTRSILLGIASLAAGLSSALAQTAVTDPVGYITVNVAAKASGAAISAIAPTLVNKVEFAGTITAISATEITVSGTPFTASAFAPVGGKAKYYVEITSGAGEGAWTNIGGNTTSGLTTVDDMTPFAAVGATIKVRAHTTVAQFFGASNTAGLLSGADAGLADEVFFVDASSNQTTGVFYDGTGWFDADFNDAAGFPIEPQQGLLVKHKNATAVNFVHVGHVKTGKTMLSIYNGLNVTAIPQATGVTLGASNLFTGNAGTGLASGPDAGVADEVFVYSGGNAVSYFNDGTGWFDGDFNNASTVVLKEGTAAVIKRKGAGVDFPWVAPKQDVAP